MAFLITTDFETQIKLDVLAKVTDSDSSLLFEMELAAIEEMKSYLYRYDIDKIFNQKGKSRNRLLVMYCVDIMLYHLHSRINPRQIPELRYVRYESAKKWLEGLSKGIIVTTLPKKEDDNDGDGVSDTYAQVKISTFPKRSNNY